MLSLHFPKFAVLSVVACLFAAAASCSTDGVTPTCPALPLYDAATANSPDVQAALAEAVKAGCATAPQGGSASTAPSSGGGGGGKPSTTVGGNENASNAGAAGSN